jgi:hypothetical protein
MGSGGGSVGLAGTTKHAKVVVGGDVPYRAKWGVVWLTAFEGRRLRRCGCSRPLHNSWQVETPEREGNESCWWCVNDAFDPAILGRGVGARETQLDTMGEEERTRGVVVELAAIMTLEGTDWATELGGDPGEVGEGGKRVGLQPKRESPQKMREVIQNG